MGGRGDKDGSIGKGLLHPREQRETESEMGQVATWMSRVHEVIEAMLGRHALRKVEIRGDCYIVIAGLPVPLPLGVSDPVWGED